jgi:uncharacterized RDD family membrane protein YckC
MAAACVNHPDVLADTSACAGCANTFCLDCLVSEGGLRVCAECRAKARAGGSTVLAYAGLWPRSVAWFIDAMIVTCLAFSVIGVFGWLPSYLAAALRTTGPLGVLFPIVSKPSAVIPHTLVMIVYEGLLLQRSGQTFGKMLLKLEVTERDGNKLTAKSAWIRAASKAGFGLFGYVGFGQYLIAFVKREKTAGHDLIAATRVISR